ncbi:MAG TPA: helix-turn-helix domain-containing protein [Acidimicrobiales bacterium]|nr:helix-turn-helix domain-containing protein [Acidimicrobiales bacterium]
MTAVDATAKPLRSDARRNRDKIVAAARVAVAAAGGDTALEDVARAAGVGIGTLYRHFPTRTDLLEAVFLEEIDALTTQAERLAAADEPGSALEAWLRANLEFGSRGQCLGSSVLTAKKTEGTPANAAYGRMREAAAVLLARAQASGAVRADIDLTDVMRLVHGIVLVNASAPDPERQARMFDLVVAGIRT